MKSYQVYERKQNTFSSIHEITFINTYDILCDYKRLLRRKSDNRKFKIPTMHYFKLIIRLYACLLSLISIDLSMYASKLFSETKSFHFTVLIYDASP
jgi:hypothetical protein